MQPQGQPTTSWFWQAGGAWTVQRIHSRAAYSANYAITKLQGLVITSRDQDRK